MKCNLWTSSEPIYNQEEKAVLIREEDEEAVLNGWFWLLSKETKETTGL